MGSLFGGTTSKSGDASGGVSPEQMSLANFTYGQNILQNAQNFSKGMGHSTGVTMADAGAAMNEALNLQKMSQADTSAMNAFNAQNKQSLTSGIGGLGTALGSNPGSPGQ